jgi:hypothetical protein
MIGEVRHIFPPEGGGIVDNAGFAGYLREVALLVENGYYPKVDTMVILLAQHCDDGGKLNRLSVSKRGTFLDTHKLVGVLACAQYDAMKDD